MKTFTTLTAVAALIAGMSIASAQNQPSTNPKPPPNSINAGSGPSGDATMPKSGSQSQSTAKSGMKAKVGKVSGSGKFCTQLAQGGPLTCKFASLQACEKQAKVGPQKTLCVQNPKSGTVGKK